MTGLATRRPQAFGLLVTLAGAAMFFPDALIIRFTGTDPLTFAVWRGLAAGTTFLLATLIFARAGLPPLRALLAPIPVLMIFLQGSSSALYLASLKGTSVANALLILATAPFLAALLSWLLMRETIDRATSLAIVVTFAGVAIIASGSVGGGLAGGKLWGDALALANAFVIAGYYTVLRKVPEMNLLLPMALGCYLTAILAFPFAPMEPLTPLQGGLIFLSGGVILAGGTALLMIGPRYLPAPEVAMITLLEIVASPLLVWWVLGEDPGPRSVIGGALILAAIFAHSALRLRKPSAGRAAGSA